MIEALGLPLHEAPKASKYELSRFYAGRLPHRPLDRDLADRDRKLEAAREARRTRRAAAYQEAA